MTPDRFTYDWWNDKPPVREDSEEFEPDRDCESDHQNPGEVSTEAEPGDTLNKTKTP